MRGLMSMGGTLQANAKIIDLRKKLTMKQHLDEINRNLEEFAHILTCKVDSLEREIDKLNTRISTLEKAVLLNNMFS